MLTILAFSFTASTRALHQSSPHTTCILSSSSWSFCISSSNKEGANHSTSTNNCPTPHASVCLPSLLPSKLQGHQQPQLIIIIITYCPAPTYTSPFIHTSCLGHHNNNTNTATPSYNNHHHHLSNSMITPSFPYKTEALTISPALFSTLTIIILLQQTQQQLLQPAAFLTFTITNHHSSPPSSSTSIHHPCLAKHKLPSRTNHTTPSSSPPLSTISHRRQEQRLTETEHKTEAKQG